MSMFLEYSSIMYSMCAIFFSILMFRCVIVRNTAISTYILSMNTNNNEVVQILISSSSWKVKETGKVTKIYVYFFPIFSEFNNSEVDRVLMSSSFV